jgi:cytochrome c-type biogenesis protein CcmH/NrfF
MENNLGIVDFLPQAEKVYPTYINKGFEFNHLKLIGHLRCLDCDDEFAIDQADSYMCRKVHQTVSRLANKGWDDKEILRDCTRIYGNEVLLKHYAFDPPILV